MRPLVLTPKFKRAFRKFVKRNADLQKYIEDTLQQMEAEANLLVFSPVLAAMTVALFSQSSKILDQLVKLLCCLISGHMMRFIKAIGV
jgi:hypothetical protein